MDPVTIGTAVVAILTPYFKDAGTEVVKAAGEAGVEKVKGLVQWLKGKFAGDPVATADLTRFEKNPDTFGEVLKTTIATKAQEDPAFASEAQQKVKELGPVFNIVQRFDEAIDNVGLKGDHVGRGTFNIEQTGKKGSGNTGAEIKST
jgi:hypothetical protein